MRNFHNPRRRLAAKVFGLAIAAALGSTAIHAAPPEEDAVQAGLPFDGSKLDAASGTLPVRADRSVTTAKVRETPVANRPSDTIRTQAPSAPAPQRENFFRVWQRTWDKDMEFADERSEPIMEILYDESIREKYVPAVAAAGAAAAPFIVGAAGAFPITLAVLGGLFAGFAAAFVVPFALKYVALMAGWFAGLIHGGFKAVASRFKKPKPNSTIPIIVI